MDQSIDRPVEMGLSRVAFTRNVTRRLAFAFYGTVSLSKAEWMSVLGM